MEMVDLSGAGPPSRDDSYQYLAQLCRALITHGAPLPLIRKIANRAATNLGFLDIEMPFKGDSIKVKIRSILVPCRVEKMEVIRGRSLSEVYHIVDIFARVRRRMVSVQEGTSQISNGGETWRHRKAVQVLYKAILTALISVTYQGGFWSAFTSFFMSLATSLVELVISPSSHHQQVFAVISSAPLTMVARALAAKHASVCFGSVAQATVLGFFPTSDFFEATVVFLKRPNLDHTVLIWHPILRMAYLSFGTAVGTAAATVFHTDNLPDSIACSEYPNQSVWTFVSALVATTTYSTIHVPITDDVFWVIGISIVSVFVSSVISWLAAENMAANIYTILASTFAVRSMAHVYHQTTLARRHRVSHLAREQPRHVDEVAREAMIWLACVPALEILLPMGAAAVAAVSAGTIWTGKNDSDGHGGFYNGVPQGFMEMAETCAWASLAWVCCECILELPAWLRARYTIVRE
jgi:uncharacterized membrane protein YjjP (DUF1212 family)